LLGRANDSTLVLTDDYASTRHARISLQDGVWFVEDLGSDCFVHLVCGGLKLVARLPAQDPIKLGQRLDLNVDPERVHLFHQERRID
jgi:pSer/pThr/pTyr-binding forkhead associated (FHA) protein